MNTRESPDSRRQDGEKVRKPWRAPQLEVSTVSDKTQTQANTRPYDATGNLSS